MGFATAAGVGASLFNIGTSAQASSQAAEVLANTAEAQIDFLRDVGGAAAQDISASETAALEAARGVGAAADPLRRFADVGTSAFDIARQNILTGQQEDAISRSIAAGGVGATGNRFAASSPVSNAINRRARLAGLAAQPGFNEALLGVGQTGISATGDIAGIGIREAELAGDITRQAGASTASALIGQASLIGDLGQDAASARLLGQIGQQQAITSGAEDIATLLGRTT